MTVTDHSTASDAEFVARFGGVEGRGVRVENAARAAHQEQNRGAHWGLALDRVRDEYRRIADAVLAADAAFRPATPAADEALRQVLADLVEAVGRGDEHGLPEAYRAALTALGGSR